MIEPKILQGTPEEMALAIQQADNWINGEYPDRGARLREIVVEYGCDDDCVCDLIEQLALRMEAAEALNVKLKDAIGRIVAVAGNGPECAVLLKRAIDAARRIAEGK